MEQLRWVMEHPVDVASFAAVLSIVVTLVFCALRASARSNAYYDDLTNAVEVADANAQPINTWAEDKEAMATSQITLEEFCDRRWAFRNLR